MKTIEKTLLYYELLMTYNNTSEYKKYNLPEGYRFEYYKPGDEDEWCDIHIHSGEFCSYEEAMEIFHEFYDFFIDELDKRCIFIVDNNTNEKIGTATISLLEAKENDYEATVDWVAIKEEYQGKHLAKPLISKFLEIASTLGHKDIMLHTQTHTWLAANLYLDFGFKPYKMNESTKGWQILKTITNNPILIDIEAIKESDMYSNTALLIEKKLEQIYGNKFNYQIWHKNGRNDVIVYDFNKTYEYKYYKSDNDIKLEEVTKLTK